VAGKARVHELAKELNITSKDVLQLLAGLGEYVKSAASIVEAPVADQVRRKCGGTAAPAGWQQGRRRQYPRNNPYQDLGRPEINHRQAADGPVRPPAPHRPKVFGMPRPRRAVSGIPMPPPHADR
jgi:translation initiation factor IF-2